MTHKISLATRVRTVAHNYLAKSKLLEQQMRAINVCRTTRAVGAFTLQLHDLHSVPVSPLLSLAR